MAHRDEILAFADELLDVRSFPEYGPGGAQVLGAEEVSKLVCGVSAARELFERARVAGAQLVLVHHGLFWRNEPLLVEARQRGRLEALFAGDLTLAAYHLALDAHPEVGNSAQLAERLGLEREGPFTPFGVGARLPEPEALDAFVARVRALVEREPLVLPFGPGRVGRVAVATGAGGYELLRAAREGYDLYLTGEAEEPNWHAARELGISLVAAGHHATERFGVQALAARLAAEFGLEWEFVELTNPI